jgi:8-oxo-dGTP pyrophosphatase MutT (NUDIX family)
MTDQSLLQRFSTDAQPGAKNVRARDAATLILLDRSGPSPKVLMGLRHQKHVFVPNKFVFPGGRVDPADRRMAVGAPLNPHAEKKLMMHVQRPSEAQARALALAAVRETFEETGLLLGSKRDERPKAPTGPWSDFAAEKIIPDLGSIHFIARAITPPRRPRRFDARFFTADVSAIAHQIGGKVGPEHELIELKWIPLATIKQEVELLVISEIVLNDLKARIEAGFTPDLPVPFYHVVHGKRVRDLL